MFTGDAVRWDREADRSRLGNWANVGFYLVRGVHCEVSGFGFVNSANYSVIGMHTGSKSVFEWGPAGEGFEAFTGMAKRGHVHHTHQILGGRKVLLAVFA